MLRFRINVGIRSVPGDAIERALLTNGHCPSTFEVLPMVEDEYKPVTLIGLYRIAEKYARCKSNSEKSFYHIGVASGIVNPLRPINTSLMGKARVDMVYVCNEEYKLLQVQGINPDDQRYQLKNSITRKTSSEESLSNLVLFIEKLFNKVPSSTK